MLSPGRYHLEIKSHNVLVSSSKGTPYIQLNCEVISNEEGTEQFSGELCAVNIWLSEKTVAQAKKSLRKLGYTHDDLEKLDPQEDGAHSFSGTTFVGVLKYETYRDRPQARWEINQDGERASSSTLKNLSKLFRNS